MTRTINLLSPEALERLQAGPEGTDVVSDLDGDAKLCGLSMMIWTGVEPDPEPLSGVAGWEGAPLYATVDCGDCQHRVAFGKCCPHCAHGCSMPGDPECPANEEK